MNGKKAVSAGNTCSKWAAQERGHFISSRKEVTLGSTLVVEGRELRQKSCKIQMGGAQGVCFQMRGEINLEILRHSYSSMTAGR